MFKDALWMKLLIIAGLSLLLSLALQTVDGTVAAREQTRDSVKADIAASIAGSQTLSGPVLVLPYRQREVSEPDSAGRTNVSWSTHIKYWLPEELDMRGDVVTQPRHRGIYQVEMFRSAMGVSGFFEIKPDDIAANPNIEWGKPYLAFGVSDVRGIASTPILKVNDQVVAMEPSAQLSAFASGLHGALDHVGAGRLHFDLQLDIRGTEGINFLPLGRETVVSLASKWPHPSFIGRYLPDAPEVSDKGFDARWTATFLSNNMESLFASCMNGDCTAFRDNSFGVKLIEAVDVYLQSDRATKYGFLFVVLTFAAFFLFEVIKELRIHPVQYSLVGVSLVLFFLLLISLTEHMSFVWAYGAAAVACVGLLTFYVSFVLRSAWRGLGFGVLLGTLFAALYGLLQSEDFALLLGSLLLFLIIAVIMIITRKLDWYALSQPAVSSPQKPE